jgi:hypothetical protein
VQAPRGYAVVLAFRFVKARIHPLAPLLGLLLAVACQTGSSSPGRTIEACSNACWLVAAADCKDIGSECIDLCLRGDVSEQAQCPEALQTYFDCFWETSAYTCDEENFTRPTTCDVELAEWRRCSAPDAAALDAGNPPTPDADVPLTDAAVD